MMAQTVLMSTFWNTIIYSLKVSNPLICVLRLVNGGKNLPWDTFMRLWIELKKQLKNLLMQQRKIQINLGNNRSKVGMSTPSAFAYSWLFLESKIFL